MTRIPQLEQELVAAAARIHGPRRRPVPAARAALVAGALVVVVLVGVLLTGGDGGGREAQPADSAGFPPSAKLEDMLGVFRGPAVAADDLGISREEFNEIPDHQPGEDPTQSRRVEWPGATIFLWPMRDGVCNSVASKSGGGSGSGCVPLDHLARQGVSVGLQSSGRHQSVYGVVVDGTQEVVITSSAGPDLRVNVKENFFFADLNSANGEPRPSGWETGVQSVRWRYADKQRSFNLAQVLRHDSVPPAPSPEVSAGEPTPGFDPIAESASDPLEFGFAGTRYTALGFQTPAVRRLHHAEGRRQRPDGRNLLPGGTRPARRAGEPAGSSVRERRGGGRPGARWLRSPGGHRTGCERQYGRPVGAVAPRTMGRRPDPLLLRLPTQRRPAGVRPAARRLANCQAERRANCPDPVDPRWAPGRAPP